MAQKGGFHIQAFSDQKLAESFVRRGISSPKVTLRVTLENKEFVHPGEKISFPVLT